MVFVDIINLKLRKDSDVSKYIYSLAGINIDGKRGILEIWIYHKDIPENFLDIFQEIKTRGATYILFISSPLSEEYNKEILQVFPKSKIEISIWHEMKSSKKYVYYKDLKSFNDDLKKYI